MKNTLILILLLSFLFQISTAQDATHFASLASQKYQEKDFNYALNLIEKAIETDSADIWTRILAADILMKLNRIREAEQQLIFATQIDPEVSEPYNRLGNLYSSINDMGTSIKMFDRAIQYAESDTIKFSYHINRASVKGMLRDFDGAVKDFEEAYAINDTDIALLNNLGALYGEMGEIDKGIALSKKSIQLYPDFLGPYINLGLVYSEIDSLDQSEYYFNLAIDIDPEEPLLYNNRGYLFYKRKDYQRALVDINKSLDMYPNNSYAYRNRALVYLALKLEKEACKDLEAAIHYEFKARYGNEVDELYKANCQ